MKVIHPGVEDRGWGSAAQCRGGAILESSRSISGGNSGPGNSEGGGFATERYAELGGRGGESQGRKKGQEEGRQG